MSTWKPDTPVGAFPEWRFALILGLVAPLAVVVILSVGGWGRAIPGTSSAYTAAQSAAQSHRGSPATETQPTTRAPDATAQLARQAAVASGPACTWQQGGACSTEP